MKTYRPTFKDRRTGKTKKCSHWYLTFVDNKQIRRRLPAFPDKRATDQAGQKIEELLSACGVLDRDLQKWIESIPDKMRDKLIEFGLIDNQRLSANLGKLLTEHLKDYLAGLAADDRKPSYIEQTRSSISRVLTGCNLEVWSDIDGNQVKTFLAKGRGPNGYGQRTYNTYLQNFKSFCRWLVREKRVAGSDPMDGHDLVRQTEFRRKRRALTIDEIDRLLRTTEASEKRFKMTGFERSLCYRLAVQTGLRAGEIRSLTTSSFDFECDRPTVHVEASDSKGKRSDDLILTTEMARLMKDFLKDRGPQDAVFNMPRKNGVPDMIRADMAEAGVEYEDASGRVVDFHALRHTFITSLTLAGVHPTVTQKLARHANITTTMKYYTHVLHESKVAAIDSLENLTCACPTDGQRWTLPDGDGQKNRINETKTALSA